MSYFPRGSFRGRIYPNGKVSIGYVRPEKKRKSERDYEKAYHAQFSRLEFQESGEHYVMLQENYEPVLPVIYGLLSSLRSLFEVSYYNTSLFQPIRQFNLLEAFRFIFSSNFSQAPPKRKYGLKGISSSGRNKVRNAAYLLQKQYGKERLGFLTLTLPAMSEDMLRVCALEWSELKRIFIQRLRRLLTKRGACSEIVEVTEIQEKRYKRTGTIALHSHIVYVASRSKKTDWYILASELRSMWKAVVSHKLSKFDYNLTEYSFDASIDCQRIKKSCEKYLGKYMSKGGEVVASIAETDDRDLLPSKWWYVSRDLKLWIVCNTIELTQRECRYLMTHACELVRRGIISYFAENAIVLRDDSVFVVGLSAYFKNSHCMDAVLSV